MSPAGSAAAQRWTMSSTCCVSLAARFICVAPSVDGVGGGGLADLCVLEGLAAGGLVRARRARQEQRGYEGGRGEYDGGPEGDAERAGEGGGGVRSRVAGQGGDRLDAAGVTGQFRGDGVLEEDRERRGADRAGDALDRVQRAGSSWCLCLGEGLEGGGHGGGDGGA